MVKKVIIGSIFLAGFIGLLIISGCQTATSTATTTTTAATTTTTAASSLNITNISPYALD